MTTDKREHEMGDEILLVDSASRTVGGFPDKSLYRKSLYGNNS